MTRAQLALGVLLGALTACSDTGTPTAPSFSVPGEEAARWPTWVLPNSSALRPPPPPSADRVRDELEEIVRLQREGTAVAPERLQRWAGTPTAPWTGEALGLLERYWVLLPDVRSATPAASARAMALLHIAMYDALVATWEAKYTYRRQPPHAADRRIRALLPMEDVPSYPSEHAAVAAAASAVLSHLFPLEDANHFQALAREAGDVQVAAGTAYRSDVEAGYTLGRSVATRVLEHARRDGFHQPWTGSMPAGPFDWRPTPPRFVETPFDPLAGSWRTWVILRGDAFRPAPPPPPGSADFERDIEELRRLGRTRTAQQADIARYWATDAPSARWEAFAAEEVNRRKLPALHAARAHALISVAMYDAFVACWDAKFHYWLARPVTVDPQIATVFSTPPFPSYPSGHSTISAAAAEVFAELFPDAARHYHSKAHEASLSRVLGGVHYRFDVLAGEELGKQVGQAVVAQARR